MKRVKKIPERAGLPSGLSPQQLVFRRLMANPLAVFGLSVIALTFFIALGAYFLAPDHSPDANRQLPEVALKPPGFTTPVLLVRKNQPAERIGFFHRLFYGETSPFRYHPFEEYAIRGDTLLLVPAGSRLRKEENAMLRIHLADILFPVEELIPAGDKRYIVTTWEGERHEVDQDALTGQVKRERISRLSFPLGTDRFGRCMLSRLILGVRISLIVGFIAVLISVTIGILLGALGGYFGGKLDELIVFFINTIWSIPTLLMVFAIVLALGRSAGNVYLAVGLTMWVDVARIVRGQILEVKSSSFVEAAKSMGFSHLRIIRIHILPNILGPITVIAAANFATAILIEAGLSYLGFGIQPPTPSWGNMLNENYGYALSGKPFLAMFPALAIMLLVLAFNLVGNALRDAIDVKSRK
jgi:peptide/nickel transport system permease protein